MISCITKNSNPYHHSKSNWVADYKSDLDDITRFQNGDMIYVIEEKISYRFENENLEPIHYNDGVDPDYFRKAEKF